MQNKVTKILLTVILLGVLIVNPPVVPAAESATTETVLYDDFETMNAENWHIPTWQGDGDGTFVGRTQFRCAQDSALPQIGSSLFDNFAIITVDTYNPTGNQTGNSFYGYDLISNQSFAPVQGLIITVRARLSGYSPGVVGGIFLYALNPEDDTLHDEIDFELLGNDLSKVWTNIYGNEPLGAGHPESYPYASGSARDYHTYEILWLPDQVLWSIDGTVIRTYAEESLLPTGPMYLHLNMWVPDADWADAYSASLQPDDSPDFYHTLSMSVDSVTVTQIMELTSPTVTNSNGATGLTSETARLRGDLTSAGGVNPIVHIYWGDNDGGTDPDNWDNDINLGTRTEGGFSKRITGLSPYTTYYYRCYAENPAGGNWASETASFITYHTLNISINGSGSTTPSAGLHYYPHISSVNLTATPEANWRFINWTGDTSTVGDENSASTNITMNGDYSITANFVTINSLTITPDNPTVITGQDQSFTATSTYPDGFTVDLTDSVLWSSNDTTKAAFYLDKSDIGDLAFANDGSTVYSIDTENDKIYKSADAGTTWTELGKPLFIDELQLIEAFPYDENTIAVLGDENKIGVYLPGSESWQDISDMGSLSPTILYDIDVSQPKFGVHYIAAAGKSAAGPGLYYYDWGAAAPEWKDAAWTLPEPGRDAFNAVAFSPNFESDYIAVALSSKASGGDDALLLHAFSFSSLSSEPFTNWQQFDDYPVIVDTASGNFTVNKASLALLPDYAGSDESLRILFAGYTGTDDTGETGGIFLMLDTIKKELTSTPVAINSIATDGTNLAAGAYDTNLVYYTTQPLASTPNLLSTEIGSSELRQITVGYSGEEVLAGSIGEGSYLAVSTNHGETFFPRSFIENFSTIQTLATGQVTITAQYGPLVDTTVLTITDPTKVILTMAVNGTGSVTPAAGPHEYDKGTTVNITATPAAGWKFVEWCGDVTKIADPHSNNTTVIVYNDCVVTAVFALDSAMEWSYTYGGTGGDEGYSVCPVRDGGFAIAGYTTSFGTGGPDVYLIKTDVSGNGTWYQTFNGGQGYSIRQTTDDGYVITGYKSTGEPGWYDVWLIKTDTHGHELWSKTYGGDSADIGQSVCQTTDGGYILAGYTSSYGSGLYDAWLIKTDSSGNMTWSKTFGDTGHDYAKFISQTEDGGYIITGQKDTNPATSYGYDLWLIKTDASGNIVFDKTYDLAGYGNSLGYCVQQTSDGGYIVTGSAFDVNGIQNNDVWLIKTDSEGNKLWDKKFGNSGDDFGHSVCQTNDGGFLIVGYFGSISGHTWLIKTDAWGNEDWNETFGYNPGFGRSACQTADGGYVVTGYYSGQGYVFADPIPMRDVWLFKLHIRNLSVGISGNGTTSLTVGNHEYIKGSTASISATPVSGYQFVNWTGDIDTIADTNSATTIVIMNADYTITANFAAVPQNPGGGGGFSGGGGGGSSGSNGKTITSLRGSSSATGVIWATIQAVSMDNKTTLDIPYGTKAVNANGNALTSITITQIVSPNAAQTGVTIIGTVYEFSPKGASFDPPLTLTISYNEADIPAEMLEGSLTIAIWDAESGTYKAIDCQVDTETNTITASISHFSRYTIVAMPTITTTPEPIPAPAPTVKPAPSPTSMPAPAPTSALSPTPQPTLTPSPVITPTSTPAPKTTGLVAALPVEPGVTNWLIISFIIGGVIVVGLLVIIFIRWRQAAE